MLCARISSSCTLAIDVWAHLVWVELKSCVVVMCFPAFWLVQGGSHLRVMTPDSFPLKRVRSSCSYPEILFYCFISIVLYRKQCLRTLVQLRENLALKRNAKSTFTSFKRFSFTEPSFFFSLCQETWCWPKETKLWEREWYQDPSVFWVFIEHAQTVSHIFISIGNNVGTYLAHVTHSAFELWAITGLTQRTFFLWFTPVDTLINTMSQ
jgi:hypothetical protein